MKRPYKTLAATGLAALLGTTALPTIVLADDKMDADEQREQLEETRDTLQESVKIVNQMKKDPEIVSMLQKSKGVFLMPNYGRAALGVGAAGGEGVLLTRSGGQWGSPMFYNSGSINVGLEAGIEAGQIAMLLMTDKAVESFMQEQNFSLNADAGLTILDWSARAQASAGKGDIVMWSDTEGLFGGLAIEVQDIVWDDDENQAYYGAKVKPQAVQQGQAKPTKPDDILVVVMP